jgi:hypothetical protein
MCTGLQITRFNKPESRVIYNFFENKKICQEYIKKCSFTYDICRYVREYDGNLDFPKRRSLSFLIYMHICQKKWKDTLDLLIFDLIPLMEQHDLFDKDKLYKDGGNNSDRVWKNKQEQALFVFCFHLGIVILDNCECFME